MTEFSDAECLEAFVRRRDQDAFARLVQRFGPLVYSAARRQSMDADAASDIAQAVFIVLIQKSAGIKAQNLAGWLVKTTYLVAKQARRDSQRRRRRELIAASMVPSMSEPEPDSDADWEQIARMLDVALYRLPEKDRNVVSMRYLQQRSVAEIAQALALSETAARKRLERAIIRLRRDFASRGVEVAPSAIGASLAAHGVQSLPPGVGEALAHGALTAAHGAAASSAAFLAKGVILVTTTKKIAVASVLVLMFASIAGLAVVAKVYLSNSQEASPATPAADVAAAAAPQAVQAEPVNSRDKIRVGIYLSEYTASGPHWIPENYGYQDQIRPVQALRDPSIDLVPVVEPATEDRPTLARLLRMDFPGKTPLNSANLDDLETLDVLISQAAHNVPSGTQTAIHQAVRDGVGFLNRGFMTVQPGFNSLYGDLSGMQAVNYGFNYGPIECTIVGDSPLLGDLAGHVGQTMMIEPAGPLGRLKGIPLIRISDMHEINQQPMRRVTEGTYMYPLSLSQFGKGRIVTFAFAHYEVPQVLQQANHGRFYIHCVQWLAGKPIS
jgi:RNA polymerase sigma factor (sigma-70 family)